MRTRSIRNLFLLACLLAVRGAWAEEPHSAIFVMNRDGSEVRALASLANFPRLGAPRWSQDGSKLVFETRSGQPERFKIFVIGADGGDMTGVAAGKLADWSPDDKQLVFSGGEGTPLKAGIWAQNIDGRGLAWLAEGSAPRWSPDGSQIAIVDPGGLYLLDQLDGSRQAVFAADDRVIDVRPLYAWSPDGRELAAVVERNGRWEVVIAGAAKPRKPLRTRLAAKADSVAWSPDGKMLAVALWNEKLGVHRLHLASAAGDEAPQEIPGQEGDNREPAFSPDGRRLAFVSTRAASAAPPAPQAMQAVKLEQSTAFDSGGTCYSLALAPDGRTALIGANMGNKKVQVWDVDGQTATRGFPMTGIFVATSPDGRHGACTERFKSAVTYFKLDDGTVVREFPLAAPIMFVEFSGDGSRLVCGSHNGDAVVFDVDTGKQLARFDHNQPVGNGALSPDGSIVATSTPDHKVHLWHVASGKKLRQLDHPALVWGLAFSPDGRLLATGTGGTPQGDVAAQRVPVGSDNTVRLWDVAAGKVLRELAGHQHAVYGLAFSPDSGRLATGSFDGTLRLWSVEQGTELARTAGKSWIFKVVFSPDGKLVLTAGGNARHEPTDRRIVDYPDERVRVFKIVPTGDDREK
jgi:WD40 repeat protein